MEPKASLYACIVGLILVVWLAEAAPIDSLSDEEHLKRTLYKLDSVLDELVQRTADSHTSYQKRNEDGSLPYKRAEADSGDVLPPAYYANLLERALARRRAASEVNAPSAATSENNLRKVLRYLADMEQKLQKRDHDIPFPFVGRRAHEKK